MIHQVVEPVEQASGKSGRSSFRLAIGPSVSGSSVQQ